MQPPPLPAGGWVSVNLKLLTALSAGTLMAEKVRTSLLYELAGSIRWNTGHMWDMSYLFMAKGWSKAPKSLNSYLRCIASRLYSQLG